MRSSMSSAVYAAAVSCRSTRRRVSTTGSRLVTFVSRSGGLDVEAEALTFKRYQGPGWGLPAVVDGCIAAGQEVAVVPLTGVEDDPAWFAAVQVLRVRGEVFGDLGEQCPVPVGVTRFLQQVQEFVAGGGVQPVHRVCREVAAHHGPVLVQRLGDAAIVHGAAQRFGEVVEGFGLCNAVLVRPVLCCVLDNERDDDLHWVLPSLPVYSSSRVVLAGGRAGGVVALGQCHGCVSKARLAADVTGVRVWIRPVGGVRRSRAGQDTTVAMPAAGSARSSASAEPGVRPARIVLATRSTVCAHCLTRSMSPSAQPSTYASLYGAVSRPRALHTMCATLSASVSRRPRCRSSPTRAPVRWSQRMWASSCRVVLSRCAVLTSSRTFTSRISPPTVTPLALPRYWLPGGASSKLYPASLISLTVSS